MSTERSDQLYAHYLEAAQKFDYFVTGVSLALVGYLGQALHPANIGWNPATIELLSIVTLLGSAVSGLKRIETNVTLIGVSHRRLYEQEAAGSAASAALSGGAAINKSTGEVFSAAQLVYKARYYQVGAEVTKEKLDKLATESGRWYRVRNASLIVGLGLLILSRILPTFVR
jgi:hypothetical protein